MSGNMVPPPPKWVVDLDNGVPAKPKNAASIPDPPGFTSAKALSSKQARLHIGQLPADH